MRTKKQLQRRLKRFGRPHNRVPLVAGGTADSAAALIGSHFVRRIARILVVSSALAVIGVAALSAPSDGLAKASGANTEQLVSSASAVTPTSEAYWAITTAAGQTANYPGLGQPVVTNASNVLELRFIEGNQGYGTVTLELPAGQSVEQGTVYSSESGAQVIVDDPGPVCQSSEGQGTVRVDQLTEAGPGNPISAAFQFFCQEGGGNAYVGTMSYDIVPTTPGSGYYIYRTDGGFSGFGNDDYLAYLGNPAAAPLTAVVVGMAITPDQGGYWEVTSNGGVFSYGTADFYGSMGGMPLNQPIVGIAATPDGKGYWLVAADGGVFAFGDAKFYGSMGGKPLNRPVVGLAAELSGNGYWEVAADGGVFAFGDAKFHGSMGGKPLDESVVGLAATSDGGGYWEVAADGGVFAFGAAPFDGSMGGNVLNGAVVGMALGD